MENELRLQFSQDELEHFLLGLEKLNISLEDTNMLQQLFSLYRQYHFSVEDCIEFAFVRLRSDRIEILCPSRSRELFRTVEDDELQGYEEVFFVSLPKLEKQLFDQLGILLPEVALSASDEVQVITVKIHDSIIPLQLGDEPPSSEITEVLYNTLVQHIPLLISIDEVEYYLAQLQHAYPTLIQAVLESFTIGEITRTLRDNVHQGILLLDLQLSLERMLDSSFALPAQYR